MSLSQTFTLRCGLSQSQSTVGPAVGQKLPQDVAQRQNTSTWRNGKQTLWVIYCLKYTALHTEEKYHWGRLVEKAQQGQKWEMREEQEAQGICCRSASPRCPPSLGPELTPREGSSMTCTHLLTPLIPYLDCPPIPSGQDPTLLWLSNFYGGSWHTIGRISQEIPVPSIRPFNTLHLAPLVCPSTSSTVVTLPKTPLTETEKS